MIDKKKIAAVTVLYNPDKEMLRNIHRYKSDVAVVYAVDNSEVYSPELERKLRGWENVTYIHNGANLGIARALNIAAQRAIHEKYDFLLTMDQDSKVQPGMIPAMLECIGETGADKIGIITPVHLYAYSHRGDSDTSCEEVLTAMTSGNLLNLSAYRAAGPFCDDLFIDHVDDEYCMRLRLHGFKIIRANNASLKHGPGQISEHRLFFKKFAISNHPPLRRYYETRNKFYLMKYYKQEFPDFFRHFYARILREILILILYERDKLKKLFMMAKGYYDYRRGNLGKYSEQ